MIKRFRSILPQFAPTRHKGENGRVAVFGGSFQFTGAPYYSSMALLKGGADLAHIFCSQSAGIPIKSYSPEMIVHPNLLYSNDIPDFETLSEEKKQQIRAKCLEKIELWIGAFHSIVIGPGLGRDEFLQTYIYDIIQLKKEAQTLVLDADGLYYLGLQSQNTKQNAQFIDWVKQNSSKIILTPNPVQFERLNQSFIPGKSLLSQQSRLMLFEEFSKSELAVKELEIEHPLVKDAVQLAESLNYINILQKGLCDIVTNGKQAYIINEPGSLKRCGGIGDLLCGLVSVYTYWGIQYGKQEDQAEDILSGCMLASLVTRKASFKAFNEHAISTTAPNIINKINAAFQQFQNYSQF